VTFRPQEETHSERNRGHTCPGPVAVRREKRGWRQVDPVRQATSVSLYSVEDDRFGETLANDLRPRPGCTAPPSRRPRKSAPYQSEPQNCGQLHRSSWEVRMSRYGRI